MRANGLRGTRMYLDEGTVMGTENAVMASVLVEGDTVVGHAACEPHIQDLCRFLVALGARIEEPVQRPADRRRRAPLRRAVSHRT